MLKLRGDGSDLDHRQFLIGEVLAVGWVRGKRHFESAWELQEEERERTAGGG